MANGNNSYSGVQGSGPGTSSSFGVALLDRQVKRSEELMKRKEDREDKLTKAMIIGEVGGWLLDGVVNDFHNSNTTTYGNMQTVLDNSKSVIQQNQAIVDSGKSYDEYFYDKEYNKLASEFERQGKSTMGTASAWIMEQAKKNAEMEKIEWMNLVESARGISGLTMEDLKARIEKDYDVPQNIAQYGWQKLKRVGSRILGNDVADQKGKEITLAKLEGKVFDDMRSFKAALQVALEDGGSGDKELAARIANTDKKIVKTTFSDIKFFDRIDQETGQEIKMQSYVTRIEYADGTSSVKENISEIGKGKLPITFTHEMFEAVADVFTPEGQEAFYTAWNESKTKNAQVLEELWTKTASNADFLQRKEEDNSYQSRVLDYLFEGMVDIRKQKKWDLADPNERAEYMKLAWDLHLSTNQIAQLGIERDMNLEEFLTMVRKGDYKIPDHLLGDGNNIDYPKN